jgi:hypothetical protein
MKIIKKVTPIVMLVLLVAPLAASAITLEDVGNTIGVGTADLKATVINIIQWVLGLLGLIAVIMILYGGFIWMTAGGNEDKVSTAKKIITAAVVGLIVILLAWAIVTFVVKTAVNVTE